MEASEASAVVPGLLSSVLGEGNDMAVVSAGADMTARQQFNLAMVIQLASHAELAECVRDSMS